MILYHFTARERVDEIVAASVLKPTDPLREDPGERAKQLALRYEGDPLLADAVADWNAEEIGREFGGPLVIHLTEDHRDCRPYGTARTPRAGPFGVGRQGLEP